jgi:hypothetical protein
MKEILEEQDQKDGRRALKRRSSDLEVEGVF